MRLGPTGRGQGIARGPLRPYGDSQLHLVGQGQLQRVGVGVYCLLENILLGDIRDGRLTPTRIPLTLLRVQPFRGYLRMTHPSQGYTKTSANEKSLACKLSFVFGGRGTGIDDGAQRMVQAKTRGDCATELWEDVGYRVRRSCEWLSIDSDLSCL